jgi:hypothetical protein
MGLFMVSYLCYCQTMTKLLLDRRDKLTRPLRCPDLSDRTAGVLRYILQCWLAGFFPSVADIAMALAMSNIAAVSRELELLKAKGYLHGPSGRNAKLRISDKALELAI